MSESVYSEKLLDTCNNVGVYKNLLWHPVHSLLAVTYNSSQSGGNFVSIYNENGDLQIKLSIPGQGSDNTKICQICWHPHKKHLVVTIDDGEVYCWYENEKSLTTTSGQHSTAITVAQWSPCGLRLVTGDKKGVIVAWKLTSSKAQLEVVFHHELNDCFTTLAFKTLSLENNLDIGGLAKAAVGGDEQALDFFNSYRSTNRSLSSNNEVRFYLGAKSGLLYFVNNDGSCIEVAPASSSISCLLYHQTKDVLVVVNESPAILHYISDNDGTLDEISRLKLARSKSEMVAIWAGKGVLAVTLGEQTIRIIDIENGYNYSISLEEGDQATVESITSLAYLDKKNILVVGTNLGNIQMWINANSPFVDNKNDPENQWQRIAKCSLKGVTKQLMWNTFTESVAVNMTSSISLLISMEKSYSSYKQNFAVQLSANCIAIESLQNKKQIYLQSEIEVRGLFLTNENIAVWSGQKLVIYGIDIENKKSHQIGCFPTETMVVVMHEQNTYIVEGRKIQIRTFQGTVKQTMGFLENEGNIIAIDICGIYLAAATTLGCVKLWELSRREARPFSNPKLFANHVNEWGTIASIKVNCSGNKVALLFSKDIKLLVWDIESGTIIIHDFSKDLTFDSENISNDKAQVLLINPKSIFWDLDEPRILSCEILTQTKDNQNVFLVSMFITTEHGILIQDVISMQTQLYLHLVGVQVPYFYLLKKDVMSNFNEKVPNASTNKFSSLIHPITMKDFIGLDEKDSLTKDAIMNFSFNLSIGNMDEAFKAIKKIKSAKIWENMARMCVKTKRLDVASVCLGHMGDAKTARALRETETKLELEARVALLAVHLEMLNEAEKLYKNCKRYDLLNKFYQSSGQWEKALEIAETSDRVHLKSTYYNYANYLEAKGDLSSAITNYEKSQTHLFEVPRMLLEEPSTLETYVVKSQDKKLLKWWAQYLESAGEMETALKFYEQANDSLSLVRVYCYCNNLEKAAEIADNMGDLVDRAACYHLGRQYENIGNAKEAVNFFTKAHAYNNAIRICKEQGLEDQLLNLALMGGRNEMIDVARYYEKNMVYIDRAVMLYHKGGVVGKAVDLAFKSDQREALEQLAYEMDENSDPQVLHRCAAFFLDNGQPDRAVDLLVKAKSYSDAISLCMEQKVTLTDQLVEKLSPPKDLADVNLRNQLLERIAECCYQQDNYHLATKKFTQAGNKIKAMKALLKSGDTERIIFFANVSRQPQIFIMAANYMQTLDWRKNPEIMKSIINFYTKGKALDLLAGFFESCAEVEIDEFQNYEKALGALHEALKNVTAMNERNRNSSQSDKLERLQIKLEMVKKFVNIRGIYEENSTESMRLCQSLFKEDNLNVGVRLGDVYGFMVEHYAREKKFSQAYGLICEMKSKLPNVNLSFYIDSETLTNIYRAMDMPYTNSSFIIDNQISTKNGILEESEHDEVKEEFY